MRSGPIRRAHYPPPQAARPATRSELDGYTNAGGAAAGRAYAAPADPYASMAPGLHYAPGAAAAASPSPGSPANAAGVYALPGAGAAAAPNPYTTAGAPAAASGVHGVAPASMYSQLYPAAGVGAEPVAAADGYGQYVASPLAGSATADPYDLRNAVGRQSRYGRSAGSRVHPY